MNGASLDHKARKNERRRQLIADCLHYGADPQDLDDLTLERLFALRWNLLHGLMAAPRR